MLLFDTIVSLVTPRLTSAVCMVRMSGNDTLAILDKVIFKDSSTLEPNRAYVMNLYKDGKNKKDMIDQCVLTFYKGPKSYTGFDMVEFSLHGSILIADELIETLTKYGARVAQNGEFSYQAFYNDKMSLLQSEKINELIHAKSLVSKNLAITGITKDSQNFIEEIKDKLLFTSSSIEFIIEDELGDHDDYVNELQNISETQVVPVLNTLKKVLSDTKKSAQLFNGIKVALVGEPNVGKSTLLNKILNEDKAIVTAIPGTTRDVVEGETIYNGIYFKLFDTAGIRETDDLIESLGIEKSKKMMNQADVILFLSDNSLDYEEEIFNHLEDKNKPVIRIFTKKDISNKVPENFDLAISSKDESYNQIFDLILKRLNLDDVSDIKEHLTQREISYLEKIINILEMFVSEANVGSNIDVLGGFIMFAIDEINEMLGLSKGQTKEDVYASIFKNFCLGK